MTKTELRTAVMTAIDEVLDEGIVLETVNVVKLNDVHLTGIVFNEANIGKTFYLEDFDTEGKSPCEIAEEIMIAYESNTDAPPYTLVDNLRQTLDEIKDSLIVTLLDIGKNKEYLQNVPFREVGPGLAFICRAYHTDGDGNGMTCATITNDLVESNNWDINDLFDIAIENTMKCLPPRLYRMSDTLFASGTDDLFANDSAVNTGDILILTNDISMFGATSLFLPSVADTLLNLLGEDYFAIPSSLHEFLVIPAVSSGLTINALRAMCRDANQSVVSLKDVLSDNVLLVTRDGITS